MSARGTALSMNIVWNSAIKGSSFLQASVKGIHSYSGKLEKINLLKATKFPVINRHLDSLNKNLRKLQQTSAKISRTPMDLGITKSRDTLKAILRETKAVERATKQTAFYSQKDAQNRLQAVRASRAEANALTRASKAQARKDKRRNVSAGAVVGTAMALAPLVMPLKTSFDFQYSMARVKALSGADDKQFKQLRNSALNLSASTKYRAKEVAQGQQYLVMAGFKPSEIIKAMPGVLNLATAGDVDLKTTADISSNIMGGFEIPAKKMNMVADILAKTITTANVDIRMLGDSMRYAAPIAKKAGLSLAETSAMAGLLGNIGIQGSMAGTTLKSMVTRLSAPPTEAKKALDALHIQTKDKKGNTKSIPLLLQELYNKTKDKGTGVQLEYMKKIFGLEPLAGGAKLIDLAGKGELKKYIDILNNYKGTAKKIADIQLDTVWGQTQILGSAIDNLAITMSDGLLPSFQGFVETMVSGINVVKSWADEHPKLAGAIYGTGLAIGVATVALVGFGLIATFAGAGLSALAGGFGIVTGAISFMGRALLMNPIGWAVAAIAGGAYLIYSNWDKIKPFFNTLWNGTKEVFNTAWNGIKSIVTTPVELIKGAWMTTKTFFNTLWNGTKEVFGMAWGGISTVLTAPIVAVVMGWDATKNFLNNIWSGTKEIFSSAWDGITSVITAPINTIRNMWTELMNSIKKKLAWFSGAIEKVKNGWGAVKNFFSIGGDDKKPKTLAERQANIPKALRVPANNPLYAPTKAPLHQKGVNPHGSLRDTLMKPKQVTPKPVLPKPVPHAMVESPTAVTAGHLSQNKMEIKNDHSQTHISNQYTIIAKGTDAQEVLALIKQHERASATQKRDTQLKDAV
jgi:TP901 family phage tail tape measure protein